MYLAGEYFPENSAKSTPGFIALNDNSVVIYQGEDKIEHTVTIKSIQDGQYIYCNEGCLFILKDKLPAEKLKAYNSKAGNMVSWLQLVTVSKMIILATTLLAMLLLYRSILYAAIPVAVENFPVEWEQKVGEIAYSGMLQSHLKPSALPESRIEELTAQAQEIIEVSELAITPEIKFHYSAEFGANALAFPGGPVVITDDMVDLLQEDEQIMAVVAHEIAHIKQRHHLYSIIEILGISAIIAVWLGAYDSLVQEIAGVAVALKMSRAHEKDADIVGLKLLTDAGIDGDNMVQTFKKLTARYCPDDLYSECAEETTSWLSTHPSDADRIEYLSRHLEDHYH